MAHPPTRTGPLIVRSGASMVTALLALRGIKAE